MKDKHLNKLKPVAVFILLILLITIIFSSKQNEDKINVGQDYYETINKEIIANNKLESDEQYWSLFATETQEKIDDKVSNIVKELKNNNENMNKLYNSVINQKNNLSILDSYIEKIDNSSDINQLMNNIIKINNELSMGLLINYTLEKDFKNNEEVIVNIYPFVFDFGNTYADYYSNPLYSSYASTFIKYDREIFKLYGYSDEEAKQSVKKIIKFYGELAENSKTIEEHSQVSSLYNIQTDDEINKIYTNINIDKFLDNYNKDLKVSIVDVNQAKVLNNYLTNENLDTLKEYVKLQILQNYAAYGSTEYYDLMIKMNAELGGTEISQDTVAEYATDIVSAFYDTEISQKYLSENVSESSTQYFRDMIDDIIAQYETKIKNNEWLSEDTKEKALIKLENLNVNVGYPEKWPTYSNGYKIGDNLLENIINMNKASVEYSINSILNKEEYWAMSILTVNAYYNPQDNSINFPAALLEYELYNENNSYYENLGSLGMVIAHEITHAFDNNGALFDEKGNLKNWWTEADYKNFEKLQQEVIEYYDVYKINGKSVDGKQTVSENIADLGAVSCIVEIAKQKGATEEELKQLFEAYANIWASKATEEYTYLLLSMDTHSPDKIRVNAVLQSIDDFYSVYDITDKDDMYKEQDERVKVW